MVKIKFNRYKNIWVECIFGEKDIYEKRISIRQKNIWAKRIF